MIIFLIKIFIILLIGLFISKFLENLYYDEPFYIVLQLFIIGTILNIIIFIYNTSIFKKIEIKRGPRGVKGEIGDQGLMGNSDFCSKCDNDLEQENVGSEKIKADKKKVIVETPVLSNDVRGEVL